MNNNLKKYRLKFLKEIYLKKSGEKFLKNKFGEDKYKSIVEDYLKPNNYIEYEKLDTYTTKIGQQILKEVLSWKCTEKGIQYYEEEIKHKNKMMIDIFVKIGILILGFIIGLIFKT